MFLPLCALPSTPGSLFLSNRIPPGRHIPVSRAPRGKELGNNNSPEQLGSLFTVLAACAAALPVCLKHLGNTQSLQKFEHGAREQKWIQNKISPKLSTRTSLSCLISCRSARSVSEDPVHICAGVGRTQTPSQPTWMCWVYQSLQSDQLLKYSQLVYVTKQRSSSCLCTWFILSLHWNIHTFLLPRLTPPGTSQVVQWLRFWAPNAGGPGSIPVQGTISTCCN